MGAPAAADHAAHMDAIYGVQRHFYDATRKYYLLGRDRLIRRLYVPDQGSVLEIGCGTGRNLAAVVRRYPTARLHGLDISSEMLKSARANLAGSDARLVQADATGFDAAGLFGRAMFDRVFLSYTVSMIPDWRSAIGAAMAVVAPGGQLHIVDFGQQGDLPGWFGRGLRHWLSLFEVTPRVGLLHHCALLAKDHGFTCESERLYRDYAWSICLRR